MWIAGVSTTLDCMKQQHYGSPHAYEGARPMDTTQMDPIQETEHRTTSGRDAERPAGAPARRAMARGSTVIAAAVAAVLGWAVAHLLLDIDLTAETGAGGSTREVGAVDVVLAGLLVGLTAWLLLSVLERLTTRPRTVWTVLAVAVLVFSLTGPLAATTASATVALMGLHVLVGLVLIVGFRGSVRDGRTV
jgi:hypothetical protein